MVGTISGKDWKLAIKTITENQLLACLKTWPGQDSYLRGQRQDKKVEQMHNKGA